MFVDRFTLSDILSVVLLIIACKLVGSTMQGAWYDTELYLI